MAEVLVSDESSETPTFDSAASSSNVNGVLGVLEDDEINANSAREA